MPDFDQLVVELDQVREAGLGGIRKLELPQLTEVARATEFAMRHDQPEPAAIEELLRAAAVTFGDGIDRDVAESLFGLANGMKYRPMGVRRDEAASTYGAKADSFRKAPEQQCVTNMAEGVMAVMRETALRRTRLAMEQQQTDDDKVRHPADSRLAVQWVERFEAYNRMWTPAYGMRADLLAALTIRRDYPALLHEPDDTPVDADKPLAEVVPLESADDYALHALYFYAQFELELKRFCSRYGGMWLLSDPDTEVAVSDAVYQIGWNNSLTEDDQSWLRRQLADARHEEQNHFMQMLTGTTTGSRIASDWLITVYSCHCDNLEVGDGSHCRVHAAMNACNTYIELIDQDWLKIVDWYRPASRPRPHTHAVQLFRDFKRAVECPALGDEAAGAG